MIAFRTDPDPAMIDTLFRSSALYLEKWEWDDYRDAPIAARIDACHGTFIRSKRDHPYFIRFNEQTGEPYVVVPLLAKYVQEHQGIPRDPCRASRQHIRRYDHTAKEQHLLQ